MSSECLRSRSTCSSRPARKICTGSRPSTSMHLASRRRDLIDDFVDAHNRRKTMTSLMKKLLTVGVAVAALSTAPMSAHAGGFGDAAGIAAGIIGGIIAQSARPQVVYITPRIRVVRVHAPARRAAKREPIATPTPDRTAGPPTMD